MMEATGLTMRQRLERAAAGDADSWRQILARHHNRLLRAVAAYLDLRVRRRVDPADVLQEVYLELFARLPRYLEDPRRPFHLWLQLLARERLGKIHRRHLRAGKRAAGREVQLAAGGGPGQRTLPAAAVPEGHPGEAAVRADLRQRLRQLLERLSPSDREVLALRHFEQLGMSEVAAVLGISEAAASKRYLRAIGRLRDLLADSPGGLDVWRM
jgi:RNA polymerase sigma-70 factor (ECF subfamily)